MRIVGPITANSRRAKRLALRRTARPEILEAELVLFAHNIL